MLMEAETKPDVDRAALKRQLLALLEDREVRRALMRIFEQHSTPVEEEARGNRSVFI